VTLFRLEALDSLVDWSHAGHHLNVELVFSLHGVSTLNSDLDSSWLDSPCTDGYGLSVLSVSGGVVFEKEFNGLGREELDIVGSSNAAEVRGP